MTPNRKHTRGYPVAVLIGLETAAAHLWQVFSRAVKPMTIVRLDGNRNDPKALYNFHESIINALRPTLKQGVRTIIVASPPRTTYSQEFIAHVGRHHAWLTKNENKVAIAETTGAAATPSQVALLANSAEFRELVRETTSEETENLLDLLEKRLGTSRRENAILFSLEEAENLILHSSKSYTQKAEYIILTNKYLADSRQKNRLQRLLQIASNKKIKTRVVDSESPAGKRVAQLGGFLCIAKSE